MLLSNDSVQRHFFALFTIYFSLRNNDNILIWLIRDDRWAMAVQLLPRDIDRYSFANVSSKLNSVTSRIVSLDRPEHHLQYKLYKQVSSMVHTFNEIQLAHWMLVHELYNIN